MNNFTLIWAISPFLFGLVIYLLPRWDRYFAVAVVAVSLVYGLVTFWSNTPISLQLLDQFGVRLYVDHLSGYFILTNALVTFAVLAHNWSSPQKTFFLAFLTFLHGSLNSCFIANDLITLYVGLEVISLVVFVLIAFSRQDRPIWVAMRYLILSNTALLFYLIGAILVYQANQSFAYAGITQAPLEAVIAILLGLFTKGGVFISGLWSPLTNAVASGSVSAMLSGIVEKAAIFPLIRFMALSPGLGHSLQIIGMVAAIFGVGLALFQTEIKRMLAFSTISQLGWLLLVPQWSGFYGLTHGLAKASLFLSTDHIPERNFSDIQNQALSRQLWLNLLIPSLSISGLPLLAGFGAKSMVLSALSGWPLVVMTVATVGTACVYSKLIFLPWQPQSTPAESSQTSLTLPTGYQGATVFLLVGLVVANSIDLAAYDLDSILKALLTLGGGWLLYGLVLRKSVWQVPQAWEGLEHLVGMMALILLGLFWLVRV